MKLNPAVQQVTLKKRRRLRRRLFPAKSSTIIQNENKMANRLKRILLFSLLGLSYGLFTYYFFGGWWNSSAGTLLMLFFSYLIWKDEFAEQTGLNLNLTEVGKSLFLACMVTVGAYLLMKYLSSGKGITIRYTHWKNYYHDIFYTLNEEIALGSVILFGMVRRRNGKPLLAAIELAMIFSVIHFIFYRWIMNDRGTLTLAALATLFFVGFVRNSLILLTGHIGYSWALHFGWMAIMFGCYHGYAETNQRLTEPERFNLYLGSNEMLILSFVLSLVALWFWVYKTKLSHKPTV
jgi:hypothetical protein